MKEIKQNLLDWVNLIIDLLYRFFFAITNIRFVLRFILGMGIIGGLGVLIDLYFGNDYKMSIFTYSTALIGTLTLESLTTAKKDHTLTYLSTLIGIISIILLSIGLYEKDLSKIHFGFILCLILYIFVESNKNEYKPKDTTPTGKKELDEKGLSDA